MKDKKKKKVRRIKDLDAIHKIMPYLMPNRCDSEVYYVEEIEVDELLKYLDKVNEGCEKKDKMTLFHTIIMATAKTIYNRPLLNRYIANKCFYERNDISFSFIAKNKLVDNAEERLIFMSPNNEMNVKDVSKSILNSVQKTRKDNSNDTDSLLKFVTMWPKFITTFIMWCYRKLDSHCLLPSCLSNDDPNYATVLISNLGSVKAECCYHHLNNYGTNSIVMTVGIIHEEEKNGKMKKVVNLGLTLDERIADGIYFARSVKLLKYILEHPTLLENRLDEELEIPEAKKEA